MENIIITGIVIILVGYGIYINTGRNEPFHSGSNEVIEVPIVDKDGDIIGGIYKSKGN